MAASLLMATPVIRAPAVASMLIGAHQPAIDRKTHILTRYGGAERLTERPSQCGNHPQRLQQTRAPTVE